MIAAEKLLQSETFRLNWVDRLALPKLHEPVIVDSPEIAPNSPVEHYAHSDAVMNANVVSIKEGLENEDSIEHQKDFSTFPSSFYIPEVAKRQTRSKHMCPGCGTKIYGKASLNVICGDCEVPFIKE